MIPQLVRAYAAQMVLGLQGSPGSRQFLDPVHVIATAKHFLGDGGTGGQDQGDNGATEAELRAVDLAGYSGALAVGVQTVMASLSSWRGVKMHAQRGLLTEVLKRRLHFDGVVLGDWNGHAQVPGCSAVSCPPALIAGIDVLMAPEGWRALYVNTLAQVRSGEIPLERLDEAVRRMIRVKLRAHLLEEGPPIFPASRRTLRSARRAGTSGDRTPRGTRVSGAAEERAPLAAAHHMTASSGCGQRRR